jgi:hypothetical protein
MAKADDKKKRGNIDIWLIAVIVLLVLSIGGGLWITGQAILARLDAMSTQTRSQIGRLETEVFQMRKDLQSVEFFVRKLQQEAATPAAAAAKSTAADKQGE